MYRLPIFSLFAMCSLVQPRSQQVSQDAVANPRAAIMRAGMPTKPMFYGIYGTT